MNCLTGQIVLAAVLAGAILPGCGPRKRAEGAPAIPSGARQTQGSSDRAGRAQLSLADFEDSPGGKGHEQVRRFLIDAPGDEGACRFVLNETRSGAGALEVTLPARRQLVFLPPDGCDFGRYHLLSISVFSPAFRDDLCVTLSTGQASWQSPCTLIGPGWNTVLFDIRPLRSRKDFDLRGVKAMRIALTDAVGPVTFNIDDVLLLDNARAIGPTPPGMRLTQEGLEYRLTVCGGREQFVLAQDADGLGQLGSRQALMQLAAPGRRLPENGSQLAILGDRRIGQTSVLECNPVRVRLASTWFFPARAGEWASMAVKRIAWEYTFYPDGRWVTHVELNNAGGRQIGSVRIVLPVVDPSADETAGRKLVVENFNGPIGRWSYLCTVAGEDRERGEDNYNNPGQLRPTLAAAGPPAEGDADKDGFDESQGCYFLRAKAGHCRFRILPPPEGLSNPVFRVFGPWVGPVSINSEGRAIHQVAHLEDGSVLWTLPGRITEPASVEVAGPMP